MVAASDIDLPMLNKHPLTAIVLSMLLAGCQNQELRPYLSDGCSSFPDGTFAHKTLWLDCCEAHDFSYWQGGTREQRAAADTELQQCVASTGEPQIAGLMLKGVRVGGSPYWPTTYRWGYGWPYGRGYQPLTPDQRQQVEKLTPAGRTISDQNEN